MLGNIKFKAIEDLKMIRAKTVGVSAKDNYDYNKFLEDSSDDYPKYADGIDEEPFKIKTLDDDWFYSNTFNDPTGVNIALTRSDSSEAE